jgi:hypothetical protein
MMTTIDADVRPMIEFVGMSGLCVYMRQIDDDDIFVKKSVHKRPIFMIDKRFGTPVLTMNKSFHFTITVPIQWLLFVLGVCSTCPFHQTPLPKLSCNTIPICTDFMLMTVIHCLASGSHTT